MKFYQVYMMLMLTCCSFHIDAFWSKWYETIASKIYTTTDVIVHKEFKNAKSLELHNENGAVVINSWKQDSIAIEIITSCASTLHKDIKIDIESMDDIVKIHTIFTHEKIKGTVIFNILLPENTYISIFTKQGDIFIKNVTSFIDLVTLDGNITIINPHNTLHAKTERGTILLRTDYMQPSQEFNLLSCKGDIEIYTTATINARIHTSAIQGKVTSQIPITLDSFTTLLNAHAWKKFRQSINGAIGKPLSNLTVTADNGSIFILPYTQQNDIF